MAQTDQLDRAFQIVNIQFFVSQPLSEGPTYTGGLLCREKLVMPKFPACHFFGETRTTRSGSAYSARDYDLNH